jgi:hypothetical protein
VNRILSQILQEEPNVYLAGLPLIEKSIWWRRFYEATKVMSFNRPSVPPLRLESKDGPSQKISVLVSLYKADGFLADLLANILEQTSLSSAQIIFISVSPSDFVRVSLREFKALFPATKIIESSKRIGIYEAWNKGLVMTHTPLVTNWNADDRRSRTSLEQQISFMEKNPWVAGAYSDVYVTLDPMADFEIARYCGATTNFPPFASLHHSLGGANPMHNAPVWRRDLHNKLGLFDESLKSAGDYEFWLRCQVSGEVFVKSSTPHSTYFLNPKGLSTALGTSGVKEVSMIKKRYRRVISKRLRKENLPGVSSSLYVHNDAVIKKLEAKA